MLSSYIITAVWRIRANRRKFFEDFAREKEFDPHIAHNWHSLPRHHLFSAKVHLTIHSSFFLSFLLYAYSLEGIGEGDSIPQEQRDQGSA